MPYLRFSRDKSGYENTYVLHTYRSGGKSNRKLLYWFRTPPGVHMGRLPLDEDAIRAIEESNPNLSFDWGKMLKLRSSLQLTQDFLVQPKDSDEKKRKTQIRNKHKLRQVTETAVQDDRSKIEHESNFKEVLESGELAEFFASSQSSSSLKRIEDTDDVQEVEWKHPVVVLMGDETLARLRARYAEIQVRINEKLDDKNSRNPTRVLAEALNPDRWKTIEEAVRGIETFESKAEEIKKVLGRRRRRIRKPGSEHFEAS